MQPCNGKCVVTMMAASTGNDGELIITMMAASMGNDGKLMIMAAVASRWGNEKYSNDDMFVCGCI